MLLIILTITIYLIIAVWFHLGFNKKSNSENTDTPFVSVIVAAHNEEKNIANCLNCLQNQDYDPQKVEFIVVDDRSTDHTGSIIQAWKDKISTLKSLRIDATPAPYAPKKYAIHTGIEATQGEILCFTDADCYPPKQWLKHIISQFKENVGMVVGLAPLLPEKSLQKPPLWQQLSAYESWWNGFVSMASINMGFPMTCTGRNLAYRKAVYHQIGGFSNFSHSLSGDDDLLMHQIDKKTNHKIAGLTHPESVVTSKTVDSIQQLWVQRTRHFSAGKYYPMKKKVFYFIWNGATILLTIAPVLALFISWLSLSIAIIALFGKLLIDFSFHLPVFKRYNKTALLKYFLLFELLYPFNLLIFGTIGLIKKPNWRISQNSSLI